MVDSSRRQSGFELLRLISMMLIICYHFSIYGDWPNRGSSFTTDFAVSFLGIWGEIGVNCFILLSGYFLYSSRFKMTSLLRVVLETFFYSYAILLLFAVLSVDEESLRYLVRSLLPISGGNYWFITAYVAMYVVSPAVVWFEHRLDIVAYKKTLMLLILLLSVIPTVTTRTFVYSPFAWFVFVFMLGGFVRRFPDELTDSSAMNLCLLCFGFIIISEITILLLSRIAPIVSPKYAIYFARVNMLPEIGLSLGIFSQVKSHSIPYNRVINALAKSSLASYLITDNPYVRDWLWPHFSFCYDMGWMAVFFCGVISGVVLYIICACIDSLRAVTVEKWVLYFVGKSRKLTTAIEAIDKYMVLD